MKVLQVHSRYREYGGEERVVENDAALLREAGHEVLTHEVPNPSGGLAAAASLAASSWNIRQARRVRRLIEEWSPDVAHIHNTWYSLSPSVIRAVKSRGTPLVLTLHNYRLSCVSANHFRDGQPCFDCLGRAPVKGVVRGCYRDSVAVSGAVALSVQSNDLAKVWRLPEVVTVPSTRQAEIVSVGGRIDATRLEVMPNWTPDPGPGEIPPSGSSEVLFIGRVAPEKGLSRLIRLWRQERHRLEGLKLRVVCPSPIEGSASLSGLGVEVSRPGSVEPVEAIFGARAVVVPSIWEEPFGMVAIEAFACGRPAVGTRTGALTETLGQLDPDCLFLANDEATWVETLERLADDRWVDDMGLRARGVFEESFSPESGLSRLVAVYGRAIDLTRESLED